MFRRTDVHQNADGRFLSFSPTREACLSLVVIGNLCFVKPIIFLLNSIHAIADNGERLV